MSYKVPGLPVYRKTLHNRYHVIKIHNRQGVYDAFRALQQAWGKGTILTETGDHLVITHPEYDQLRFTHEHGPNGDYMLMGSRCTIIIDLETGSCTIGGSAAGFSEVADG